MLFWDSANNGKIQVQRDATRWNGVPRVRDGKTSEIDPESEGRPEDVCSPKWSYLDPGGRLNK